jgi:DNA-binding protein HU-beta
MTKQQLIDAVAEGAGLKKAQAGAAVKAALDAIKGALAGGDRVSLIGFGTFEVRDRKARTGVNPQTQKKIKIPASKAPVFRAGKQLKDAVAVKKGKGK